MTNPAGMPSIPEGVKVIVDPSEEPVHGKIVVARLDGTSEVTVKNLFLMAPINTYHHSTHDTTISPSTETAKLLVL